MGSTGFELSAAGVAPAARRPPSALANTLQHTKTPELRSGTAAAGRVRTHHRSTHAHEAVLHEATSCGSCGGPVAPAKLQNAIAIASQLANQLRSIESVELSRTPGQRLKDNDMKRVSWPKQLTSLLSTCRLGGGAAGRVARTRDPPPGMGSHPLRRSINVHFRTNNISSSR